MTTNYMKCHPPSTITFEIAGMYASTPYNLFSQTNTGGRITNGPMVSFTTGAWPRSLPLPKFTVKIPSGPHSDTADRLILNSFGQFAGSPNYPDVATDLTGKIVWFYNAPPVHTLARPLADGTMLTLQSGTAWNPSNTILQFLRQIDLEGNIIKETNTGIVQQELLALGATDASPCPATPPSSPPVGTACLGAFHHDAIQTLPNGYTAVIADIEKIFPAGTQGDSSGLPVDVIGDIIIVLDTNFQVVWFMLSSTIVARRNWIS